MVATGTLAKFLAVIAITAVTAVAIGESDPTGPQLVGWLNLQYLLSNPFTGLTAFQGNWANQHPCSGWDVGCWLANLANTIYGFLASIANLLIWFFSIILSAAIALFQIGTLQFEPALPGAIQLLLLIIVAPFWLLLLMTIGSLIRGTEG